LAQARHVNAADLAARLTLSLTGRSSRRYEHPRTSVPLMVALFIGPCVATLLVVGMLSRDRSTGRR
jgi:hypothetical protein